MWSWNPHTLLTGLGNSAATLENSLPQNAQNVKYRIILWPRNFTLRIYIPKRNENMYQFSSVAQSRPTLCDPMNHSTPGLPIHHQLPEFTQTHVHRVDETYELSTVHMTQLRWQWCEQPRPDTGRDNSVVITIWPAVIIRHILISKILHLKIYSSD